MHELDFLYRRSTVKTVFGERYMAPDVFKHGEWTLVAKYDKVGDGQPVHVYESRLPAAFYRVHGFASTNTIGEPVREVILETGSGSHVLAASIAEALANGMLAVRAE